MATLAQQLWDMLGAPLDLVDKGKYGPEKGLKWKFVDPPKDYYGSYDHSFWQKSKEAELAELINQGLQSDHLCSPDEHFRCKYCGKILKWAIYGSNKVIDPMSIYYYDFNYIVLENRQIDEIITFNYMEIKYLLQQREFTLYTLCRPPGMGYCDFSVLKKRQIPKQIADMKFTGDKFHQQFEFYGDFESANLKTMVIDKKAENCKIILKSDSNSLGFAQWFYYGVKYWGDKPHKVKFSIANQKKKHSLFSKGMKFYVGQFDQATGISWEQFNSEISYKQSEYRRKNKDDEVEDQPLSDFFNKLEFEYTFKTSGERVLFSYYKPYTFSELVEYLEKIESSMKSKEGVQEDFSTKTRTTFIVNDNTYYKKEIIGGSKLGLSLFMLEITSPKKAKSAYRYDKRKIIVITGRQHPFESPSSFVCQGIINFLISDNPIATKLKNMFIFKIIPMVNPDGVAIGNSRTNLQGSDLNRCWENPDEAYQPEVYFIKVYLNKLKDKKKDIFIFLDLHASATKNNSFLIGCEQAQGLGSNYNWVSNRLITKIMNESMSYFREKKCKFNVRQKNQCTARVILWKEFNAKYSFNFEFSMFGYTHNQYYIKNVYQKEEIEKLKNLLEQGKIDYDQYAEMAEQFVSTSQQTISDQLTNRSNNEKSNNNISNQIITTQKIISPKNSIFVSKSQSPSNAGTSKIINLPIIDKQFSNKSNEEKKKQQIQQFTLEDFEKMGEDLCHNILKFTLMTTFIEQEIHISGEPDLDISRLKKDNEIGEETQQNQKRKTSFERDSSFSQKLIDIDSNQSSKKLSKKLGSDSPLKRQSTIFSPSSKQIATASRSSKLVRKDSIFSGESPLRRQSSMISPTDKQNPVANKSNKIMRKDSIFSQRSKKESVTSIKEISAPTSQTQISINKENTATQKNLGFGDTAKSNFFQKLQNQMKQRKQSNVDSSDGESMMSISNSFIQQDNTLESIKLSHRQSVVDDVLNYQRESVDLDATDQNNLSNLNLKTKAFSEIDKQKTQQNNMSGDQNFLNIPFNSSSNRASSQFFIENEMQQNNTLKNQMQKLSNIIKPPTINIAPPLNLQSSDGPLQLRNKSSSFLRARQNSVIPSLSPSNFALPNISKTPSQISIRHSQNNSSSMIKFLQKKTVQKNKIHSFIKYVIGQSQSIMSIFPKMRSFDWVDYFTFEEVDEQIGEKGVVNKLIQMINQNMKKVIEYDTDSDPEDDIIDFQAKSEFTEDGDLTERQNKLEEIYAKYGEQLRGKFKGWKLDDLQAFLDGIIEFDENGNVIRKIEQKTTKNTEGGEGQSLWLSLLKSRQRGDSVFSNKSPQNKEQEDQRQRTNSNFSKNPNNSFIKQEPIKNNNQSYTSKLLLPKLDVVRLKNPFLPTSKQLVEQYKLTNIQKVLKYEREERLHQKPYNRKHNELNILTAYNSQGFNNDDQLELDPFMCMAGSRFFSPSKTIQQKQIDSSQIQNKSSLTRVTQNSKQQSFIIKDCFQSNSKNTSVNVSLKNSMTNLPHIRKQSESIHTGSNVNVGLENSIEYKSINRNNKSLEIIKQPSQPQYKIINTQFGSQILQINKEIEQLNIAIQQPKQTTKTLIIYQSRFNKEPYKLSSQQMQQMQKQPQQLAQKQQQIENKEQQQTGQKQQININDYKIKEEGKKTIVSFYGKQLRENKILTNIAEAQEAEKAL